MASDGTSGPHEPGWSFVNVRADHKTTSESEGIRNRTNGASADGPDTSATTSGSAHTSDLPPKYTFRPETQEPSQRDTSEPPGTFPEEPPIPVDPNEPGPDAQPHNSQRTYQPRTCRICLEVVQPSFHPPSINLPRIFQSTGYVSYDSEDPASGRLLRPCKCKGSSRYVHEQCLQQWRYADAAFGNRNYWVCPTCGFKYRVQRVTWARSINNLATQMVLTISIFLITMFVLGFIADPIINLWLDPYDTITSGGFTRDILEDLDPEEAGEALGWLAHFTKGFAGLGVLGLLKVMIFNPFQYMNMRQPVVIVGRGRAAHTGRQRMENLSWWMLLIGVGTFLWAVYKAVRHWSKRALEMASERIIDVQLDDDEEDQNEPTAAH